MVQVGDEALRQAAKRNMEPLTSLRRGSFSGQHKANLGFDLETECARLRPARLATSPRKSHESIFGLNLNKAMKKAIDIEPSG